MKFENELFYNCKIELNNGESYLIQANTLHNQKLDYWKDWSCYVGHDRIYIDHDLKVYNGECLTVDLGSLDSQWELMSRPTQCPRDRCTGCTDDLLTKKYKGQSKNDN